MNLMKPYIAHDETMHRMSPYPSISQQPMATNALRSVCASAYLRSRPRASRSSQISFGKKPFLSSGTTEKTFVVGLCGEIALQNAMGSSHTQVTLVTVTNQVFQKATLPLYGVLQRPDHWMASLASSSCQKGEEFDGIHSASWLFSHCRSLHGKSRQ